MPEWLANTLLALFINCSLSSGDCTRLCRKSTACSSEEDILQHEKLANLVSSSASQRCFTGNNITDAEL